MANFKINGVTFASETGGIISLSNANVFPPGMIIGSAVTFFNEITSYTGASGVNGTQYALDEGIDIDDLIVTYTPKNISNKLFVSGVVNFGADGGSTGKMYGGIRVKRQINGTGYSMLESVMQSDNTAMAGTASRKGIAGYSTNTGANHSGHATFNLHFGFIDSSHVTTLGHSVNYKISHTSTGLDSSNKTFYLNRSYYQTNDYGSHTGVSYIRVEEIQND